MRRPSPKLRRKATKVKLLLLDVDGVLTDGGIFIDDRGCETKRFDVRDGQGITLLRERGVEVGFMTARTSNVVRRRARELGVKIVCQGVRDKAAAYRALKRKLKLSDDQIAYVGDDVADVAVLRLAGLAVTVADGWSEVRSAVDYVTQARGGHGAVREVCELLLVPRKRSLAPGDSHHRS